jgi:hypothetical protein
VVEKRIGTPLNRKRTYLPWPHRGSLILAASLLAILSSPILGLMEIDHKISITEEVHRLGCSYVTSSEINFKNK